ncbi:MAG TPA: hypothetical protein VI935_08705 [Thermodesulfobacteriota bacterium]|nr:hypothetical protein [Thermodesulfobacteriota bacterium]
MSKFRYMMKNPTTNIRVLTFKQIDSSVIINSEATNLYYKDRLLHGVYTELRMP